MATTVKSLEERLDDLEEVVGAVRTQAAVLTAKVEVMSNSVSSAQAQLQTITTQLASVITSLSATSARLDTLVSKLDAVATDHTTLKSKSDTSFAIVRWAAGTCVAFLLGSLVSAFMVARSAGGLESTVQQQQKTLDEIKLEVHELRKK
jgi:uncharacterized coiled-coil protein SlyX